MKKIYQRKKTAGNLYEVLGTDGNTLKNHNDRPYPVLSDNISKILIEDLNTINAKNSAYISQNNSEEDAFMEIALHNISNQELNESLGYCLISTLLEFQPEQSFKLDLEKLIQWDRLFRFNPGPPLLPLEYKNTQRIREHLGDYWVNLPLNYSDSLEDMAKNTSSFVPKETINEVSLLINKMSKAELVAVHILFNLFSEFSITIPVLWVSGKIGDEDFITSFYALENGIDIYEMTTEEYEMPRFEMNRLLYLKPIIHGYMNKDQTLPYVNY
jgi:hypothetical protein